MSEVASTLGEAASQLGTFVSNVLDEQPGLALAAALAAGFLAGGGLASRLGSRITTTALRATFGNVATLVALDLLRRALEDGARLGGAESTGAE
jgi:uncharacterized membrane protein YfcA